MSRNITMKFFVDKDAIKTCVAEDKEIVLGQIIGHVTHVQRRMGTLPNGQPKESIAILGEFEAVNSAGEHDESGTLFLPDYYAAELENALKGLNGNVLFGVEVSVRPTGKAIPYAWNIRSTTGLARSAPLEGLKRLMAKRGVLGALKPPMAPDEAKMIADTVNQLAGRDAPAGQIDHDVPVIDHDVPVIEAEPEPEPEPAPAQIAEEKVAKGKKAA